ncbi:MAG: M48 family metalloprotease [Elusimicrobia bacterium]|nr:M48 family metalloprotease [Elusimicrobiota bacterium]
METADDRAAFEALRLGSERRMQAELCADPAIKALTEELRRSGGLDAPRRRFLVEGLRLSEAMIPGLIKDVRECLTLCGLGGRSVEVFVRDEPLANAACIDYGEGPILMLFSSSLLGRLSQGELRSVVAHEAAHAAFGHHALPASWLLHQQGRLDPRQALRLMAWNRRAEISCDRVGLVACKSLQDATKALMKLSSGLSEPVLRFSVDEYVAQMRDIQSLAASADASELFSSHPFSPLRVAALAQFWDSQPFAEAAGGGTARVSAEEAERRVEELLRAMEPERAEAGSAPAREAALWGGLWLASCDGAVDPAELAAMAAWAEPAALGAASVQLAAGADPAARARERFLANAKACAGLPAADRHALLQKLIVVARADQVVKPAERAVLAEMARAFGTDPAFVERVLSIFE